MAQKEKSFKDCTLTFLEETFHLEEMIKLPALEEWLQMPSTMTDLEREQLIHLANFVRFNHHDWNEHEVNSLMIGPLFALVNFSSQNSNYFIQRDLEGVVGEYRLFGKPDGMVTSGRRKPRNPLFIVQAFKPNLDPTGDPAAQALAAMIAAQSFDRQTKHRYGCYIVRCSWAFMVLSGNQFAFARGYATDSERIFDIFRVLKAFKSIVIELTA